MNWNPKPPIRFQGFPPELFGFLRRLVENNSKPWFEAHRDIYQSSVLGPIKVFASEIGGILRILNPDFDTEPRVGKTISRINNDIRFQKNRSPYRSFIYVTFTQRNASWSNSAVMYVGIYPSGISVGFYPGGRPDLTVGPVQQAIASNQRVFQKYLSERRIPQRYWELASNSESEVTKWPLPKTARRWTAIDNFIIGEHFSDSDSAIRDRVFLDRVQEILLDLYPLWLFAESEQVKEDLEIYRANARLLSHPSSKAAD
ncbi:MAG: DUF2461 family protein [Blastocatellia bacterium]